MKFVKSKILNLKDLKVHTVSLRQNKIENYLNLRKLSLTSTDMILNKPENKIVFYYPEFFRVQNLNKEKLLENFEKLSQKYKTENFVLVGSFQKHEVENYFKYLEKYKLEILISEGFELIEIFGDKIMLIVLDKENRILYSNRIYLKEMILKYGFWAALLIFNGIYLPYISSLVNF
jgi:hypothetical protein